jgi:ferredoxin
MSRCAEHGDELVWERGGVDMPTTCGRRYCPTCQARFAAWVDADRAEDEPA